MTESNTQVPDLLRRFIATPCCARFAVHGLQIALQTNDTALASALKAAGSATPHEMAHCIPVTIVRDEDAPADRADITVISSGLLRLISAGTGTMLAVDAERMEIFGFVAPRISADRLLHELLPIAVTFLAKPFGA